MARFSQTEIDSIDALWRALPMDHMWTGWAAAGQEPSEIWIFRTRAHWRRFPLTKTETGYQLTDEKGKQGVVAKTLPDLLKIVEAMPGLPGVPQDSD